MYGIRLTTCKPRTRSIGISRHVAREPPDWVKCKKKARNELLFALASEDAENNGTCLARDRYVTYGEGLKKKRGGGGSERWYFKSIILFSFEGDCAT